MKHTKGPWKVISSPNSFLCSVVAESDMEFKSIGDFGDKANAHLIAAAPIMFDALVKLCNDADLTFEQLCMVKDAIRKAKGA